MSIDLLHEKIRKVKNPMIVDFSMKLDMLPSDYCVEGTGLSAAYEGYCLKLMEAMVGAVPAVRFSFDMFAMLGADGLGSLSRLLQEANKKGFYVLLNGPQVLSPMAAEQAAETFWGSDTQFPCDGLLIDPYIGTDAIKPFLSSCTTMQKDLFVAIRTPNKTASELQDLLTGSRLVHSAAAALVARHGEGLFGKNGYSRVCGAVSAGSAPALRTLRSQYNRMFFLVDGIDYPSGYIKNCSNAFDRFGYGAIVSVGASVTAAWKEDQTDPIQAAMLEVERIKRNLNRYVTIL